MSQAKSIKPRLHGLDCLRGISALGVMVFHYASFYAGWPFAPSLLDKIGLYPVSVFYILSGLSLAIAYQDRLVRATDVLAFSVKRLFRIVPLWWLVAAGKETRCTLAVSPAQSGNSTRRDGLSPSGGEYGKSQT